MKEKGHTRYKGTFQMDRETQSRGLVREVHPEQEKITEVHYDYRDIYGNIIARAKIKLGEERAESPYQTISGRRGIGRIVKSFMLTHEVNGISKCIDILKLTNATKHQIGVYMADEPLENVAYVFQERQTVIPAAENPFEFATALHELGHGDQLEDPLFRGIRDLYSIDEKIDECSGEELLIAVQRIKESVGSQLPLFEEAQPLLQEVQKQEQEREKIEYRIAPARKRLQEIAIEQNAGLRRLITETLRKNHKQRILDFVDVYHESERRMEPTVEQDQDLVRRLEEIGFRFSVDSEHFKKGRDKDRKSYKLLSKDMLDTFRAHRLLRWVSQLSFHKVILREEGQTLVLRFPFHVDDKGGPYYAELVLTPDEIDKMAFQNLRERYLQEERKARERIKEEAPWLEAIQIKERNIFKEEPLFSILELPKKILERDATRRALRWMRVIRDRTGINLFKQIQTSPHAELNDETGSCQRSLLEQFGLGEFELMTGEASRPRSDVVSNLDGYLETYDADTRGMRERFKGVIPFVSRRPSSKRNTA